MKELITLVSLFPKKTESIASEVCEKLNKFLLSAADLIDYEISNQNEMEKTCGKQYLDNCINKVLLSITEYESAVVSMDYTLLFRPKILEKFKERTNIVFLKMSKDCEVLLPKDEAAFEERQQRLINNSKLIIDVEDVAEKDMADIVVKQIMPLISSEI